MSPVKVPFCPRPDYREAERLAAALVTTWGAEEVVKVGREGDDVIVVTVGVDTTTGIVAGLLGGRGVEPVTREDTCS